MDQNKLLSKHKFSSYPSLVKDAVSLIETNYAYLYGIDDLADQLEVTKHHLIRIFSASTGISPGQYLINVRMFHAKVMLQSCLDTPLENHCRGLRLFLCQLLFQSIQKAYRADSHRVYSIGTKLPASHG